MHAYTLIQATFVHKPNRSSLGAETVKYIAVMLMIILLACTGCTLANSIDGPASTPVAVAQVVPQITQTDRATAGTIIVVCLIICAVLAGIWVVRNKNSD